MTKILLECRVSCMHCAKGRDGTPEVVVGLDIPQSRFWSLAQHDSVVQIERADGVFDTVQPGYCNIDPPDANMVFTLSEGDAMHVRDGTRVRLIVV